MFSIGAAAGPVIMGKMFDGNGDDHVAAISRKAVTAEHNSLVTRCRAAATCFGR